MIRLTAAVIVALVLPASNRAVAAHANHRQPEIGATSQSPDIPWAVARHVWPTDDKEMLEADLDRIAELGARYVRTDLWWRDIEPTKDTFNADALGYYSWYVDAARQRGVDVVVILSGAPQWAMDLYDSSGGDALAQEFKDYAARVAQEFTEDVEYYQLWNEPNHIIIDWVDNADDVKLFRAGSEGIASHDEHAQTIINVIADGHDGPCPNWQCTLEDYMTNGALPYVDILAVDYYPGSWSAGSWSGDILDRLFATGEKYGKAVAVMETGYTTAGCAPAWNSEAGQTSWIHSELPRIRAKVTDPAIAQAVPFVMATWYELDDSDSAFDNCWANPIQTIESHFGVIRTDRSTKPGFTALREEIEAFP